MISFTKASVLFVFKKASFYEIAKNVESTNENNNVIINWKPSLADVALVLNGT